MGKEVLKGIGEGCAVTQLFVKQVGACKPLCLHFFL